MITKKQQKNTFFCGKYKKRESLLPFKKKSILPLDMYKEGLIVVGSTESYRRKFIQKYTRELINQGINVICITDSTETVEIVRDTVKDNRDNNLEVNELSNSLHDTSFVLNGGIAIFTAPPYEKRKCQDVDKKFNTELYRLLKEVNNANFENREVVVILDDDSEIDHSDPEELTRCLENIKKAKIGIIASGFSDRRYNSSSVFVEHYVIFHMYDPIEMIERFNFKNSRNCNLRDIINLKRNNFFHYRKSELTHGNVITFV